MILPRVKMSSFAERLSQEVRVYETKRTGAAALKRARLAVVRLVGGAVVGTTVHAREKLCKSSSLRVASLIGSVPSCEIVS